MLCPICQNASRKFGRTASGSQRYRCDACPRTFIDDATRNDRRCVNPVRMNLTLRMLLEGNSIRALERQLNVNRNTIMVALVAAGEKCRVFLEKTITNVPVEDVQCDEIWGFVGMKEKTRVRRGLAEDGVGDVWCFTAIERHTKLILTYHIGKRTPTDTAIFADNLYFATHGRFQLTTDGYTPYRTTIPAILGGRVDFATLVKVYGTSEDDSRYSPGTVIDVIATPRLGDPDEDRICTSHVERSNKTLRMQIRRLTRLTDAHSKKWGNHEAAMALFFAYYNFCRVHGTIKMTPAQKSGLTTETWSLERLLEEAALVS